MDTFQKLDYLNEFAHSQLYTNILPFWQNHTVDREHGGFYGQINNDQSVVREAVKGLVLNTRILWTFSAVYRERKDPLDLELATRAYEYIVNYLYDEQQGGYFWSLLPDGSPYDVKKQIYAQAFTIYGLSEYFKINGNPSVLKRATELFHLIEEKSFDKAENGYVEALNREWDEMADIRLSEKDMNERKSMNTHLHILEAYANLYLVWKDKFLKQQLENLIELFLDKIINPTDFHQNLFFDDNWNTRSSLISYGHDIETSWLLHEAAHILGNKKLTEHVSEISIGMCDAVKKGISEKGAIYYESDRLKKHSDNEIEWWAQAEGIVGYLNAFELSRNAEYLNIAIDIIRFIENYIVDNTHGEWFFRVTEKGKPILSHEKAGFWKCPYHNTRACLELIHRIHQFKS